MVSPLIRIHNATGFSMELQFQRLEPKEDEFASLLLRPGDSIDDSMAMFDAINFSGGVKRALISLSVGIHSHLYVLLLTVFLFISHNFSPMRNSQLFTLRSYNNIFQILFYPFTTVMHYFIT